MQRTNPTDIPVSSFVPSTSTADPKSSLSLAGMHGLMLPPGALAGDKGKKKQTGNVRKILYAKKSLKDWLEELVSDLDLLRRQVKIPATKGYRLAWQFAARPYDSQHQPRGRSILEMRTRSSVGPISKADPCSRPTPLRHTSHPPPLRPSPPLANSALRAATSAHTSVHAAASGPATENVWACMSGTADVVWVDEAAPKIHHHIG